MEVQELCGIFQFADDFFPEETPEGLTVLPQYEAKLVYPKWFFDAAASQANPRDDQTSIKYRMDYLFYQQKYEEACDLCECWLGESKVGGEARGIRRDAYEAILVCSVRAQRWPLALKALNYLESLRVEDAGLSFVVQKYKSLIPPNIDGVYD